MLLPQQHPREAALGRGEYRNHQIVPEDEEEDEEEEEGRGKRVAFARTAGPEGCSMVDGSLQGERVRVMRVVNVVGIALSRARRPRPSRVRVVCRGRWCAVRPPCRTSHTPCVRHPHGLPIIKFKDLRVRVNDDVRRRLVPSLCPHCPCLVEPCLSSLISLPPPPPPPATHMRTRARATALARYTHEASRTLTDLVPKCTSPASGSRGRESLSHKSKPPPSPHGTYAYRC